MKEKMQTLLQPVIDQAITDSEIVGTSIIVAKDGEVVFESHSGLADRENEQLVNEDTVFRLASMTKPIVSAAAMVLVEKGMLDLDAPITNWLPQFTPKLANGENATITVRHLLTHTSGLSYGFLSPDNEPYYSAGVSDGLDEKVLSLEENLQRLASVPLMFAPGTAWCYSLSTDILGAILEKVCQQSLPEIVEQYVTKPLGMNNTTFYVESLSKLAKAYADKSDDMEYARAMQPEDQVLLPGCGPIHYAPGRIANKQAYPSGGAGMAGTARDYLTFLETIRQGGGTILSIDSINSMTQDAVHGFDVAAAGPGYGFGMGFAVVRDSEKAGTPRQDGSYEWGGVYGSKMFVDPKAKISVVILTNTALAGLMTFPEKVTNAIYKALSMEDKFMPEEVEANPIYVRPAPSQESVITIPSTQFSPPSSLRESRKNEVISAPEMKGLNSSM
jgi:CubicO group peptidase (beta-lactamase class C family)